MLITLSLVKYFELFIKKLYLPNEDITSDHRMLKTLRNVKCQFWNNVHRII